MWRRNTELHTVWRTKLNWNANRDTTTRVYVAVRSYELRRRFADFVHRVSAYRVTGVQFSEKLSTLLPKNTSNRRGSFAIPSLSPSLSTFASLFSLPTKESLFLSISRGKLRVSCVTTDFSLSLLRGKRIYRVWSRVQCVSLLLWFYGGTSCRGGENNWMVGEASFSGLNWSRRVASLWITKFLLFRGAQRTKSVNFCKIISSTNRDTDN